jgi:hypothetical protein
MSEEEVSLEKKKRRNFAGWQLRREKRRFVLSAVLLCALHYRRQRAACTLRNVLCIPDEGFSFLIYLFFFFLFFIYSFPLLLGPMYKCREPRKEREEKKPKPKEMNVYEREREREREKEETAHSPEKKG